ncbi:MAG: ABC transporter ATP-binding protein [Bacteroides sp.]|nr:ABC transporter ATP-binding protein [Bacteroides sp.]
MITAKDIVRSYDGLRVVDGVSLSVADGEFVSIVGPSGAGKTTLLQIIGSLDRPDSGSVSYDGTEITSMGERELAAFRNRNMGFVFQFHQLLPEFTLAENVAMPAMIGGMGRRQALARAGELLVSLGLGERLDHRPSQLSGGERQRGAVARALINDPRVILADEPTGSLDSHNRRELLELFARLRDTTGKTLIIVTHDESLALSADRVIRMADGHILSSPDNSPRL